MSTARIGPTLAIVASCEGCAHRTATKIGGRRSGFARCVHPSNKRDAIFSSNAPTPAWCPELPSARLAMAREIVAGAEPNPLDLVTPDEAAIHRRMGSTPVVDPDALFGQELRVYPRTDEERAREAQKESE